MHMNICKYVFTYVPAVKALSLLSSTTNIHTNTEIEKMMQSKLQLDNYFIG